MVLMPSVARLMTTIDGCKQVDVSPAAEPGSGSGSRR